MKNRVIAVAARFSVSAFAAAGLGLLEINAAIADDYSHYISQSIIVADAMGRLGPTMLPFSE